jgi:hypothetical protein
MGLIWKLQSCGMNDRISVRLSARRSRKVAAEMTSFMKHLTYVGKDKMFGSVTYDEIMM